MISHNLKYYSAIRIASRVKSASTDKPCRHLALDRACVGKCEVLEVGAAVDFNSNPIMAANRRLG